MKINKFFKFLFIFFELINLFSIKFFPNQNYNNLNITNKIKLYLFNKLLKKAKKNLTYVNFLYIQGQARLGNFFICINNAIIFCEFLGCKRIIIEKNNAAFIKHKIFYKKYNFSIEPNQVFNYMDNNSLIINKWFFFKLNFSCLGKVNRFNLLKEEILNNLPKLKIHPHDLYIYIRSGDIFSIYKNSITTYSQPPLCFYQNILNNFNFRKVNIISEDKLNPVIPILLNNYSFIKYKKNNFKYDIAYLVNSFNIVSAKSSFLISLIKLNGNLQFLWEYDFYKLSERYLHLHYSVYSFSYNYTIYKMEPSLIYKKILYTWTNSSQQRQIMLKDKCINNFDIINTKNLRMSNINLILTKLIIL